MAGTDSSKNINFQKPIIILNEVQLSENVKCTSACPPSLPCLSPPPAPTAVPFPPISCVTPAPTPTSS